MPAVDPVAAPELPFAGTASRDQRVAGHRRGRGRGSGRSRGQRFGQHPRLTQHEADHSHSTNRHHGQDSGQNFSGQLTGNAFDSGLLRADAPAFVPLQAQTSRSSPPPIHTHKTHRSASLKKSQAADIATRTHEDIANNIYECPICTSEVSRKSRIWSCKTCWTVFHLGCIKKWSSNEGSTLNQAQNDLPPKRQWRCPGCNLPKEDLPSGYTCWCEKEEDPGLIAGLPPHSCGQTCGKPRSSKRCPHPCETLCHAGPCPPCPHMGPARSCFCGKESVAKRCRDTDYESAWSCGQPCNRPMGCEHCCPQPCHEGDCGACTVQMAVQCYCGKATEEMDCHSREISKTSRRRTATGMDEWTGSFDCGQECRRPFDCGQHFCQKRCHPQNASTTCPFSPEVITHCPCGKSSLTHLLPTLRSECTEPVPHCDQICLKPLPCGHACQQVCHADECMPCFKTVEITCRCGRTRHKTMCHQGINEPPQCSRQCRATLNCGRHECGDRCCSGEKKATDRQATKRKLKPLGAARMVEDIEAEHICTRVCGRLLKCGNHHCMDLCHKGACGSCREAIFEEVSCHCGRTVLQPPLPCGTPIPQCRFECDRSKACGHPRTPHNCHGDDEQCPKCPFLCQKPCLCGKKVLKNQPCFLNEVRCGAVCGRLLKCGSHYCRRECHKPGKCEDSGKKCEQACGKAKKSCDHPCTEPCHAPSPCKETIPCQSKIFVTCECQHLKQEAKCGASKGSEGNRTRTLPCNDECARLARNKKLAEALSIDPETHQDSHIPYSAETLKFYRENVQWAQTQEREFRLFAADEKEKRLRFKPMPSHYRGFLHSLADDFGLDSESMDPEPHRHVAIFKTPRFVMAPMKTLAESLRSRMVQVAPSTQTPAAPHDAQERQHHEPYNALLLTSPRFGLTVDELQAAIAPCFASASHLSANIHFLPSNEVVVRAVPVAGMHMSEQAMDTLLQSLRPAINKTITAAQLTQSVQLCAVDLEPELVITHHETDTQPSATGWSRVAARKAAPRSTLASQTVGSQGRYTVLSLSHRAQRKAAEEAVLENWDDDTPN